MRKTVFAGKPPKLSSFDLSHEHKLTCNMGELIPILNMEVIPGDTMTINSDMFMRLMPLAAPMMHRVDTYIHYFFVPTRLVWDNWDKFLTGGADGTEAPIHPFINLREYNLTDTFIGSLFDYFGLPCPHSNLYPSVSTLPLRAYNLIYNEWYRDENLIEPLKVLTSDGNAGESADLYKVRRRAWHKGYFESALPWTQRGISPTVPISDLPVVTMDDTATTLNAVNEWMQFEGNYVPDGVTRAVVSHNNADVTPQGLPQGKSKNMTASFGPDVKTGYDNTTFNIHGFTGLLAKGEYAGIEIQSLRMAAAIQHFLEKSARGGARYIEFLREMFRVKSSDARLQRPEYLGGGKSPIVIGEVVQTSETENTPQGWLAGQGISAQKSLGFTRSFEEFGYVIGILSVIPRATYEQGIHRMWNRFGRYDQILPAFSGIGDQAVHVSELYAEDSATGHEEKDFGYVPRFEECRRMPSSVHGEFRLDGGTLGYWHMGRYFDNEPVLSKEFVECSPTDRVFAVQDGSHKLLVDIFHNIRALRPLPLNGRPGLRTL